jgi:purine nucleoside permease
MHSLRMFETVLSITRYLLTGASVLVAALFAGPTFAHDNVRPVKVMIINMFGGKAPSEASAFTGNLRLTESIPVRGLSPDYPNILCNCVPDGRRRGARERGRIDHGLDPQRQV